MIIAIMILKMMPILKTNMIIMIVLIITIMIELREIRISNTLTIVSLQTKINEFSYKVITLKTLYPCDTA